MSRLANAGVHLDPTDKLLRTLARGRIVSDTHRFALQAAYLRQPPA